jgi:Lon protease-like protein
MVHALSAQQLCAVPLFPLPNVVLFPRAVLPLHIFEERYKAMTADALAGDRLVAMALLKPGWERDYYRRPAIEPVVCVGRILTHELLADGTYNFLLQGITRAKIIAEVAQQGYRQAQLQELEQTASPARALATLRRQMIQLLDRGALADAPGARQFQRLLQTPMPSADIADLLAFTYLEDVWLKQSLLAEPNVPCRIERLLAALTALPPFPARRGSPQHPSWN